MLLTNLTQHLKSHYLGSFPRSSSLRFCLPFLLERCLVMSWYGYDETTLNALVVDCVLPDRVMVG